MMLLGTKTSVEILSLCIPRHCKPPSQRRIFFSEASGLSKTAQKTQVGDINKNAIPNTRAVSTDTLRHNNTPTLTLALFPMNCTISRFTEYRGTYEDRKLEETWRSCTINEAARTKHGNGFANSCIERYLQNQSCSPVFKITGSGVTAWKCCNKKIYHRTSHCHIAPSIPYRDVQAHAVNNLTSCPSIGRRLLLSSSLGDIRTLQRTCARR